MSSSRVVHAWPYQIHFSFIIILSTNFVRRDIVIEHQRSRYGNCLFLVTTDFVWTDIVTEHQKSCNGKCLFGSQLNLSAQTLSRNINCLATEIVFLARNRIFPSRKNLLALKVSSLKLSFWLRTDFYTQQKTFRNRKCLWAKMAVTRSILELEKNFKNLNSWKIIST